MYLVNQRIILLVKMTVLLGVPLLCGFVVPWLAIWQIPSILLVLSAYYLNNLYPDRIFFEEKTVQIKLFLHPDWLTYKTEQLRFQQGGHCIYLYVEGKRRYRLSMERLSLRLYQQLLQSVQPLQKHTD